MSKTYNVGDIVESKDGSIYVVISSYSCTKLSEGKDVTLDFDYYSKFITDDLIFKISNKGVKSIWLKHDYFCVKKLISKDCYDLDKNITTFGISRNTVKKIDSISILDIKEIVKRYYISKGIIKKNSRFEYLLPKEFNKATHSANIKSDGMEDYYFERLLKIYKHRDAYYDNDLEYDNIIGYLKDNQAFLIGDTNSPMYLTDYFTNNSGKKPTDINKELEKLRKYRNRNYKLL